MELSEAKIKRIEFFQKEEITGGIVYRRLAKWQKDESNKSILEKIAADEDSHYTTYKKFTQKDVAPNRWHIFIYTIMSRILGPTFGLKLMEKSESDAQKYYAELADIPEIAKIIDDEEKHEHALVDLLNEDKLNYMGSVVLGLNDALVELTGALAGLTFALQNPSLIALTGSITGIAAAFSMAASEYLSTKSEETEKHAVKASFYTGIAYIGTVILLILPYLLLSNIYLSLGLTLLTAIAIIAGFNYYYAVVKEEKFTRRFTEMVMLSMSVALLSFGVGYVLRHFFAIDI